MKIKIADDFSKTPGHRSPADGPYSGELFLDQVLRGKYVEARGKSETLTVDLDGTAGYATSFLEASFGGLAREFPPAEVAATLAFISIGEPYLPEEIAGYIKEARNQ